jgi:hypothetical protein
MLGIAALSAYLLLPAAHLLASSAGDLPQDHAGPAYAASEGTGHSPVGCPICEKLGHARHAVATPVVVGAPLPAPVAVSAAHVPEGRPLAPVQDSALARAPPAHSLVA